jgi:hypothetical protein
MNADLLQPQGVRRPLPQTRSETRLIACSICLRVRRGSEWVEAERVIRELRSYELETPPRLRAAVCDDCTGAILSRRAQEVDSVAA